MKIEAFAMTKSWGSYGTIFAFLAFFQSFVNTFVPSELQRPRKSLGRKLLAYFSNDVEFRVDEYNGASVNELYSAVQLHLSDSAARAKRVNLSLPKNASALTFSLAENERMADTFGGVTVWWEFTSSERRQSSISFWSSTPDEKRSLHLRMHKKHREKILSSYVQHILDRAKTIKRKRKDRLLYTNTKGDNCGRGKMWQSVPFKHPSTFDTLAMDPIRKQKIMDDLTDFVKGEDFYKKIGRSWKRGYLLYGPPGTGKSSMIAAMANLLQYDVYDLELTEVESNATLKQLLLKTSNKSIIVIEDIDCSLDVYDRAKKPSKKSKGDKEEESSKVTLSGLLNFTDGLWSCCGSERIFVFTTNHIEKLDPALLRSGRMDMHIHLSYCTFEAFKVLAKNYLAIQDHELFGEVKEEMEGVEITPADVSEVLIREKRDVGEVLRCLLKEFEVRKTRKELVTEADHQKQEAEEEVDEEEEENEKAKEEKTENKPTDNHENTP